MPENAVRGRVAAYRATRPDGERTMVGAHPDDWARVSVALHGVPGVDVRVQPLADRGSLILFPHPEDVPLLPPGGQVDLGLRADYTLCACGCGCSELRDAPSYLCTRCAMLRRGPITAKETSTVDLMDEMLVGKARRIAERAHADQVDKAGQPYIDHVARVAAGVEGAVEKAVAWLHDVLEDTAWTAEDLRAAEMPPEVITAVEAITHAPHERRADYYERVRADPYARRVKLSDVADNADPVRLAELDDQTRERLIAKYAAAQRALAY